MPVPHFEDADVGHDLPAPGYYLGAVATARWTRSGNGNRMVHVVFVLDGVGPEHERVADYFVLEGATPHGMAFARARLAQLYRACGQTPRGGDEIRPDDLAGALLEVKVDHEFWRGRLRLRVVGFRLFTSGPTTGDAGTVGGPVGPVAAHAVAPLGGRP